MFDHIADSLAQAPIQSAIMKTNPMLTKKNQAVFRNCFPVDIGQRLEQYLIPDLYYKLYAAEYGSEAGWLATAA